MSILVEALSSDRIELAKSGPHDRLLNILNRLIAEFIKEGSNVVRGSAEF